MAEIQKLTIGFPQEIIEALAVGKAIHADGTDEATDAGLMEEVDTLILFHSTREESEGGRSSDDADDRFASWSGSHARCATT